MLITNQRVDKLTAAHTHFTSLNMLNSSPTSMADTLLGIFSGRHEPQANKIVHEPSTHHVLPQDHKDQHASINQCSHHNSRSEGDPEAGAEISLAKTHGMYYINPFP
jgi:hypothetical protein